MDQPTAVILLSDKRSGSTMFQEALCSHPDVRTVDYSPHTYLETHHWLKAAVILQMPAAAFSGGKIYAGYGSRENARTYMVDCLRGNIPEYQPPKNDRDLVFSGWEALCERFAHPVFFEKSPQVLSNWAAISLLLEWINQTHLKVKVIGLVRNPLSVQYSAYELFHSAPEQRQFSWLEAQRNLLAVERLIPAGDFLRLRYETIIESPVETFARVSDFIGLPRDPNLGQAVHAGSLNRWKDDPSFTLQLDPVVRQLALGFGYTEEDLLNPVKPEPPVRVRLRKSWDRFYILGLARLTDRFLKPIYLWLKNLVRP